MSVVSFSSRDVSSQDGSSSQQSDDASPTPSEQMASGDTSRSKPPVDNSSVDRADFKEQLDFINGNLLKKQRVWSIVQRRVEEIHQLSSRPGATRSDSCVEVEEKLQHIRDHLSQCHSELSEMRSGIDNIYQTCGRPRDGHGPDTHKETVARFRPYLRPLIAGWSLGVLSAFLAFLLFPIGVEMIRENLHQWCECFFES
jgi:hypothetical protein